MPIIGIICEYNPFHNGHLYHINKIKELYPDSLIILVLNGYFLERGEVSILSKEDKTKIALNEGIDIVLELPFLFGTQSADTFASWSLKILNELHVDKIIFGSESNDITKLTEIANAQINSSTYDQKIKQYLDEGVNYPTALAKALDIDFTFLPNDLLGISYIKAIIKNNYNIEPITIKRTNDYKDIISNDNIISAANIREKLKQNYDIANYVPKIVLDKIKKVNYHTLFLLLKHTIITCPNLEMFLDVDEGIEYRLKRIIPTVDNLNDLITKIKTKRYTYNRIKRMLIHILIGVKKEDHDLSFEYIRILGFNHKGQNYLNTLKKKNAKLWQIPNNNLIYEYELKAALIYDLITDSNTYTFEKKKQPIIY